MDLRTALRQGTELLEEEAVPAPRLTAEVLLCHAIGRERTWLFAHPEEALTDLQQLHYGRYLHERLQGKPTQYITRRQEFYGREFRVTPDVLIPRPETEHVVEAALRLAPRARRILDVGCGSGILAVTLRLETGAAAWATDLSERAVRVAAENARRLAAGVTFVVCDLASAIQSESLELVVSNPPYVPLSDKPGLQREVRDWEPGLALFGGPTGVEIYARLIHDAARVLRPGGWLIVELGYNSLDRVQPMLDSAWCDRQAIPDLSGIPRVLAARRQ